MTANNSNSGPPEDNLDDNNCRICYEPITDRALTDTCSHAFCNHCLRQWSQTHTICPFCRRRYRNIRANYRSEFDYDLIPINEDFSIPQDMIALENQNQQLDDYRRYQTIQRQHLEQLFIAIVALNPASDEYIRTNHLIAITFDRIERTVNLINILSHNIHNLGFEEEFFHPLNIQQEVQQIGHQVIQDIQDIDDDLDDEDTASIRDENVDIPLPVGPPPLNNNVNLNREPNVEQNLRVDSNSDLQNFSQNSQILRNPFDNEEEEDSEENGDNGEEEDNEEEDNEEEEVYDEEENDDNNQ